MAQTFATHEELITALRSWPPDSLPVVSLTPELATSILEHDPVNRKMRPSNLERLKKEISGGHFELHKSSAMRFLHSGRLADGQHRCRAVIETGITITVPMAIIADTLGVDEGALRTLADHLGLRGIPVDDVSLAAQVTHTLCRTPSASNRECVTYFAANEDFIMSCVTKPRAWLAEHDKVISYFLKPALLATIRAQAIMLDKEPVAAVDQLLEDVVNDGATAPAGSPRQAIAHQIFDYLKAAHERRGAKTKDVLAYFRRALILVREGKVRNVITTKGGRPKRRRDEAAA